MNREKAYRQAVYDVLQNIAVDVNGLLTNVPVYDNKLEGDVDLYVLFEAQTAQNESAYPLQIWRSVIEVSIYHTQQDSATFSIVDDITEIIEDRILQSHNINKFATQTGWQIDNTYLTSVNALKYESFKDGAGTVVQKILQISSQLIKQ